LTNCMILVWCLFFSIAYSLTHKRQREAPASAPKPYLPPQNPDYVILLLLVLFATAIAIAVYGLSGLTTRYQVGQAAQQINNSAVQGIVGHFCRAIPIIALTLIWINKQKRDIKFWAMIGIVGVCTVLCDDPISVARFWAGTLALGVVGTLIRRMKITGIWLPIVLVLGLIFIMPILNLTRHNTFSQINWGNYQPSNIATTLDFGDFDAYQMFADTLALPGITDANDQITWGQQLMGNVLYCLPRAFWVNKPGGSGAYVATYWGLAFTVLCEPLPAEGYINFGYAGIILYALAFGWFLGKLDRVYWQTINRPDAVPPKLLQLVYPFCTGLGLYMMRGDFSASFEDMSAFALAAWGVMWLAYPIAARRRNNRFFARSSDVTTVRQGTK